MNEELDQDAICRLCEDKIIEGSRMSYHFMCEGRFCEDATEMYLEQLEDEEYDRESKRIMGLFEEILANN